MCMSVCVCICIYIFLSERQAQAVFTVRAPPPALITVPGRFLALYPCLVMLIL